MKILNNDMYLLLIDEEAKIKKYCSYYLKDNKNIIKYLADTNKALKENEKVIIAYYPLKKEAKELDLPWLSNPFDINVEKIAMDKLKDKWSHLYILGYPKPPFPTNYENDLNLVKIGLYETKPKQFSLEDMKKAIEMAREYEFIQFGGGDTESKYTEEEIIQLLTTQQTYPKEFIPEYEDRVALDGHTIVGKELKTTTNSEGKQEMHGRYVY